MANVCDGCGKTVYRNRFMPIRKIWLGQDCGCLAKDGIATGIPRTTVNPFDITLDHCHDEFGQKIHVSNLRELSAAEKRYGFQSCVLNNDAQNFDDPPQQRRIEVGDLYKRKFSRGGR